MSTFIKVPGREAIEQEIGKRFEKIEKTLERTLEKTLKAALESPTAARAQAAAERAQERLSTARKSLDDVLLGLEHKGYNMKEPQDLIQTVGRRVLARASDIANDVRSQVAAKPYSPDWLKNVSIPRPAPLAADRAPAPASAAARGTQQTTVAEPAAADVTSVEATSAEATSAEATSAGTASRGTASMTGAERANSKSAPKGSQDTTVSSSAKTAKKSASKLTKTKT